MEAVQKVVDSLDDIYALQDPLVEADVLRDILRDDRLHMLLQVGGRYPESCLIVHVQEDDFINPFGGIVKCFLIYSDFALLLCFSCTTE